MVGIDGLAVLFFVLWFIGPPSEPGEQNECDSRDSRFAHQLAGPSDGDLDGYRVRSSRKARRLPYQTPKTQNFVHVE